eukprot:1343326-Amorphochlora_amoeboformis.AAC.1
MRITREREKSRGDIETEKVRKFQPVGKLALPQNHPLLGASEIFPIQILKTEPGKVKIIVIVRVRATGLDVALFHERSRIKL